MQEMPRKQIGSERHLSRPLEGSDLARPFTESISKHRSQADPKSVRNPKEANQGEWPEGQTGGLARAGLHLLLTDLKGNKAGRDSPSLVEARAVRRIHLIGGIQPRGLN